MGGTINYTHNSAAEAVERARSHATWPVGMCLNHVWDCLSSQVKSYGLADANAGWAATTLRRYDRNPPAGAPVYWGNSTHGHVAISVGGGKVRSTDCPRDGVLTEWTLAQVEARWPWLRYRGYGLDFAGDWIDGIAPAPKPPEDDMFEPADRTELNSKLDKADGATLRADLAWQNKTNAAAFAALTDLIKKLAAKVDGVSSDVTALKTEVDALPKA